jgi:hypothetical protein
MGIIDKLKLWFRNNLSGPLREMTWSERILLVFFGFWFGIFPIPGLSTAILLFGLIVINRVIKRPMSVSETTVAAAVNLLSTPLSLALLPVWMIAGSHIFGLGNRCKTSKIINELFVSVLFSF